MNREHAPNGYILKWPFTVTKDYLVLASCRKIALQTMEKFDVTANTGTFSRRPQSFSHSSLPEKSSGPWKDTFHISSIWKSLPIPGMRPFPARVNVKGLTPWTKRLSKNGEI
jgi:hypothetical protein